MTTERANKDFARIIAENGFTATGKTTYDGSQIYSRTWSHEVQVAWYGDRTSTLEIQMWISFGYPMVRIIRSGRPEDKLRNYSSPKRAINAIREIVRIAGFDAA